MNRKYCSARRELEKYRWDVGAPYLHRRYVRRLLDRIDAAAAGGDEERAALHVWLLRSAQRILAGRRRMESWAIEDARVLLVAAEAALE